MFDKYRVILLGLVISCGASLSAMDKKPDSPRNLSSGSVESRNTTVASQIVMNKTNAVALNDSDKMRTVENQLYQVYSNTYFPCSSKIATPVYYNKSYTNSSEEEFPGKRGHYY